MEVDGCPEWCVLKRDGDRNLHRHVGERVQLATPEAGTGEYLARLVSSDDGAGCELLIEGRTLRESRVRLALSEVDLLLDALDDGGEKVIQTLAGLVLRGVASTA